MANEITLVLPERLTPPQEIEKATKIEGKDKFAWVAKNIHEQVDILHVIDLDCYYFKAPKQDIYKPLNEAVLQRWVRDIWISSFSTFTPKDIKDSIEVTKIMTLREIDNVNSDYIKVCDGVFWDKKKGQLVDSPKGEVFYQMFDTDYPDRHNVKVKPFTEEQRAHLLEVYERVKAEISRDEWNIPYDFIMTWANDDKEVALDLIRLNAYCFLDKKPLGSGILVGLKRNGKSTYVDMLHTEFGTNNTSRVQLTQLGDPHYTHTLRFSLLNAPDEEEDKTIQFQGLFKTLSDHGVLTLPVMRSNIPIRVPCDFMSFFPMNHTPDWRGTGASACVARSLIVPFDNDLSRFDSGNENFCEKTFTAEMFSDYMGTVFAYAWFYHRHKHVFSHRMGNEQAAIQQDLDSAIIYKREFELFFDGFDAIRLVYDDYTYWCMARDNKISSLKQFKFIFKQYMDCRTKFMQNGRKVNVYRHIDKNNPGRVPLLITGRTKDFGKVTDMHAKHISIVERLVDKYEEVPAVAKVLGTYKESNYAGKIFQPRIDREQYDLFGGTDNQEQ